MKFLILLILAVIAYFIIRKLIAEYSSSSSSSSVTTPVDNTPSSTAQTVDSVSSSVTTESTTLATDPGNNNVTTSSQATNESLLANLTGGIFGDDPKANIRELLKVLNLRATDSSRLAISDEEFNSLQAGTAELSNDKLSDIVSRLKKMLD